jgi:hypothetical protein
MPPITSGGYFFCFLLAGGRAEHVRVSVCVGAGAGVIEGLPGEGWHAGP